MDTPGLPNERRASEYRTLLFITIAMLVVGPIIYLAIVYFQLDQIGTASENPPLLFLYVILGVSLLQIAVMIPLVQKMMLANPQRLSGSQGQSGSKATSLLIIRLAQIESVYVFGLVTVFIWRTTAYLPYFYAIGILGSILYWPTRERFDAVADQLEAK